jgi:arginase family enzyme
MQLCLLHLDDALKAQPAFMATCERDGARQIEAQQLGSTVRLWGKQPQLDRLQSLLNTHGETLKDEPQLCFMGSGDFHHITALLLETRLEKTPGPVTVLHFDNHPDWVHYNGGMHCGSWVNRAAAHPKIAKVITIGVCSKDLRNPDWKGANLTLLSQGLLELFPYTHAPSRVRHDYGAGASYQQKENHLHWQTIADMGEQAFINMLLPRIQTKEVYLTIDKDVLDRADAETNWDQGQMRLPFLLQLLREIGRRHSIIGADVNGDYSTPHYTGDAWTRLRKHAEIMIDQPRPAPSRPHAAALNSATNHALLEVLSEVMA